MKKDIQLIWDFDDTIVKTNVEFERNNLLCARMVAQDTFGNMRNVKEIRAYQRNLDVELVSTFGFAPPRYLLSWISTYEHFSKKVNKTPDPLTIEKIKNHIDDLYIRKYENMPYAIEVMDKLKREGYSMIILTAGQDEIQKRKVAEAGVTDYIDEVYVYNKKTPETLKEVMNRHPALDYVMIGNSLKSDIYPALENDAWGFHLQRETWEADDHDIDKQHKKYVCLSSLKEIPGKLADIIDHMESEAV